MSETPTTERIGEMSETDRVLVEAYVKEVNDLNAATFADMRYHDDRLFKESSAGSESRHRLIVLAAGIVALAGPILLKADSTIADRNTIQKACIWLIAAVVIGVLADLLERQVLRDRLRDIYSFASVTSGEVKVLRAYLRVVMLKSFESDAMAAAQQQAVVAEAKAEAANVKLSRIRFQTRVARSSSELVFYAAMLMGFMRLLEAFWAAR